MAARSPAPTQIGQVVPGKVTKLVPFGAFVRVDEGIEGLVHISELAERHVEIPEQVVQVGDEIFVKVIDIDLERRRISLSLKQANEGLTGDVETDEFDPTLYGMAATYDDQGNYIYPEGFDPETGEWLEGYDDPARGVGGAVRRGAGPLRGAPEADRRGPQGRRRGRCPGERRGCALVLLLRGVGRGELRRALASDEALAALREKLAGGQS